MKRILSLFLSLLCLLGLFAGCENAPGSEKTVLLYFANESRDNVSAESVSVPADLSGQELLTTSVERLLNGPSSTGNQAVIPSGTRLLSAKAGKTKATLDFSSEFCKTRDALDEVLCRYTLVRTVCELGIGIESVSILVDGEPLVSSVTGKPVGDLRLSDMLASLADENPGKERIVLYFANEEALLSKETRWVDQKPNDSLEQQILTELLKGPTKEGLSKVLPPETKILSVETKDNVCYVNFSAEFKAKMTDMLDEQMKVYAVVNSLTELSYVDRVQILIEGAKEDSLRYMTIQDPISRNENMIGN